MPATWLALAIDLQTVVDAFWHRLPQMENRCLPSPEYVRAYDKGLCVRYNNVQRRRRRSGFQSISADRLSLLSTNTLKRMRFTRGHSAFSYSCIRDFCAIQYLSPGVISSASGQHIYVRNWQSWCRYSSSGMIDRCLRYKIQLQFQDWSSLVTFMHIQGGSAPAQGDSRRSVSCKIVCWDCAPESGTKVYSSTYAQSFEIVGRP